MKIGIDYRFAVSSPRGIGRYVRFITEALARLDRENSYVLYTQECPPDDWPANFSVRVLPPSGIIRYEQLSLPLAAARDGADVLWYPSNSGPLFLKKGIRLMVTVHDLTFLNINGHLFSRHSLGERYRAIALKLGMGRIDILLTVSRFSAAEIRKRFGRIAAVVPNRIDTRDDAEDDRILAKLDLDRGSYIYSMTGSAPHKNLAGLLRLAAADDPSRTYVVSGVYEPTRSERNVVYTGRISDAEKNALYRHAAAFLFIPTAEGFGVPLLEAMRYALPIISADNTALPEVLGAGGELAPADDHARIRELLARLPWDMTRYLPAQQTQLAAYSSWDLAARQMIAYFADPSHETRRHPSS